MATQRVGPVYYDNIMLRTPLSIGCPRGFIYPLASIEIEHLPRPCYLQ